MSGPLLGETRTRQMAFGLPSTGSGANRAVGGTRDSGVVPLRTELSPVTSPMKAAILKSPRSASPPPLEITEVARPTLKEGHVLPRVLACGARACRRRCDAATSLLGAMLGIVFLLADRRLNDRKEIMGDVGRGQERPPWQRKPRPAARVAAASASSKTARTPAAASSSAAELAVPAGCCRPKA